MGDRHRTCTTLRQGILSICFGGDSGTFFLIGKTKMSPSQELPESVDDFTREEHREPGSYILEHCPGCGKKWYVDGCLDCGYGIDGHRGPQENWK